MPKRQPLAGRSPTEKPMPRVERADTIIARVLDAGPEHFLRDLETCRQAFLDERDVGAPSTYWAFMALSIAAARDIHVLDRLRKALGLPEVENYTTDVPQRMVEVPLWAAVALYNAWMRATVGEVRVGQTEVTTPRPLPLSEAFGLAGEGGSRTVGRHHLLAQRDRDLALEVEHLLSSRLAMSAHAAHTAVAERHGDVTEKTVARAHAKWGALARARLPSST